MGLQIGENGNLNLEYQITGDSHAFGVGIVFKFGQTSSGMPTTSLEDEISPDISRTKRLEDEIIMTEEIDLNKELIGYRVITEQSGRRIKVPVYEEDEQ